LPPLSHAERLQDESRSRRILQYKGERTVIHDREIYRKYHASLVLGRFVKLSNELADIDARRAKRCAAWWRGQAVPYRDLKLCNIAITPRTLPYSGKSKISSIKLQTIQICNLSFLIIELNNEHEFKWLLVLKHCALWLSTSYLNYF
jgi:hypothetical protein